MNGYLVDTNVISEWSKPRPSPVVTDFLRHSPTRSLHTSAVCLAEIRHGADTASSDELRKRLLKWLDHDLRAFFAGRVLDVTEDVVHSALVITEPSLRKRQAVHLADCLIAATARLHELCVVTRNARDFLPYEVMVLNPWTGERFNSA